MQPVEDHLMERIFLNPKRLLFGKIVFLTILVLVFYVELLANLYLLHQSIPLYLNYLVVIMLVILTVLEIILSHVQLSRHALEVYGKRLEWKGKRHRMAHYDEIHSLGLEQGSLDRIFRTGTIVINHTWRIKGINKPHEVFYRLQKHIPRYN